MRQKGIGTPQLVLFVVALGLVTLVGFAVNAWLSAYAQKHVEIGRAEVRLEWEAANRAAEAAQRAREAQVAKSLLAEEKRRLAAEQAADEHERKWREASRESNRSKVALGVCVQERSAAAVGADRADAVPGGAGIHPPDVAEDAAALGIRLTWGFVRQYDSAWTGIDGKPLFEAAAGRAEAEPAGASTYDLDELLDVHGENASRCSRDRREFAALIRRIEEAEAAWVKEGKGE